jgi:hypothetical protein
MKNDKNIVNAEQLMIAFSANLLRIPFVDDPKLFRTTREVAEEFLDCSPRMVNEYVNSDSLPQIGKDRFYVPDIMNWMNVRDIAKRFHVKVADLAYLGVVDFTLGDRQGLPHMLKLNPKRSLAEYRKARRRGKAKRPAKKNTPSTEVEKQR